MAKWIGLSSDENDCYLLELLCKEWAAKWNLDEWEGSFYINPKEYLVQMPPNGEIDFCCIDVTTEGSLAVAEETRRCYPNVKMLLLASPAQSPTEYVKPGILATALLLKPVEYVQMQMVIGEMLKEIAFEYMDCSKSFSLDIERRRIVIPYAQIVYFEAKERRILLYTVTKQYIFYDTLQTLVERLPAYFIRCHRGYIVNTRQIQWVDFSANAIHLRNGYKVLVSRNKKALLRRLIT